MRDFRVVQSSMERHATESIRSSPRWSRTAPTQSVSQTVKSRTVAPARAAPIAVRAGDSVAPTQVDGLLRRLVLEEGSDLHLRVGEPPILRIHGELKRMEQKEPLTGPQLDAMLASIMPQRNVDEYAQTCDTDFAHEIEGVARFRANAFRDHMGAGGVFRVIPSTVATVENLHITPEV